MKISLLFRSYGPYHLARLSAARRHHSILALEYSDLDTDYAWDVRSEKRTAGVLALSGPGMPKRLAEELKRFGPEAVAIPGYSETFALTALQVCRALRIPAILMSDTHVGSARRNALLDWTKRNIVMLYRSALVAGSRHVDYLARMGFPRERIATGYDVVDNAHFSSFSDRQGQAPTDVPPRFFFCCARLVEKKNLPFLIEAFIRYRKLEPTTDWDLVIAGDGPLRKTLERQRSASPFAANIHLVGSKSYDELPAYYGSASAFVLPSLADEWGLVVNEAMAAGLPILVTEKAGCAPDLVARDLNGYLFDPTDVDALATKMSRLSASRHRDKMGKASRGIIAKWDLERFADGLTEAAEIAQQHMTTSLPRLSAAIATVLSHRI